MSDIKNLPKPASKIDAYIKAIIDGDISNLPKPVSRSDKYLDYLAKNPPSGTITEEQKSNINKVPELESQLAQSAKYNKVNTRSITPILSNFKENFIKSKMLSYDISDTDWVVGSNSLVPKFADAYSRGTGAIYKLQQVQDGEIGVTIKGYTLGNKEAWIGLIVRGIDINNCIIVGINTLNSNVCMLKIVNGKASIVKQIALESGVIEADKNISLVVKMYGTLFSIFVNGKKVIENYSSTNFNTLESNGYFGVANYISTSANLDIVQDIEYSNLWVKEYKYDVIPSKIEKVLYCGDSNMMGQGVQENERWSNLVDEELRKISTNYTSLNVGKGGAKTLDVFNQVKSNISNIYDLGFELAGTNDGRVDLNPLTTVNEAIDNVRYSLRYMKAFGVIPIIVTPSIVDKSVNTTSYKLDSYYWLQEYRNALLRLCSQEKVICVDTFNELDCNVANFIQGDKIHLSVQGHIEVKNMVIENIQGVFKHY